MNLNIIATDVIPHLNAGALRTVIAAAERLNLNALSDKALREVSHELQQHNPGTGYTMDPLGALACSLELKGRQMARFIVSEGWSHYFESSLKSQTRWVLEKETGFVLFAQVQCRHGWRPATRIEMEDLAESLVEANEMLAQAHEFEVTLMRDLPSWAAKLS